MLKSSRQRIYRLKTIILALLSVITGSALLVFERSLTGVDPASWLHLVPLSEIGATLTAAGVFGVAWDYLDGRDRELREDERIRRLLHEAAPDFRDAVVQGFAVSPADLRRVATPELLDGIATNALALRLGDQQFATEIYAELLEQAVRAPERWHDVEVTIRLSGSSTSELLQVLIEWEYTTVPSHPVRRFACVSDRDEYAELTGDTPSTFTWFMPARSGRDPSSRESFELLTFSVDGLERPIRRSARKTGQTYSATIGEDIVRAGQRVRIRHLYRTTVMRAGNYLFVEIPQPARNVSLKLDYTATDLERVRVMDLVSSARRGSISELPRQVDARVVDADLRGWLLPRAGFTFVWMNLSEPSAAVPSVSVAGDR